MKKFTYTLIPIITLLFQGTFAMDSGGDSFHDPLVRINYRQAFNQISIYKKFESLMDSAGCSQNVFINKEKAELGGSSPQSKTVHRVPRYELLENLLDSVTIDMETRESDTEDNGPYIALTSKEWKNYEKACLSHLQKARRWAITEPAREAIVTLTFMGGVVSGTVSALGPNSYGGSISIFAVLFNSIAPIRSIARSTVNLISPPPHPLDEMEKSFALNQCFIPQSLWTSIINNFMTARQNPFSQQQCINFIEFTLGLTIYRPKPTITLRNYSSITKESIKETFCDLSSEIDEFFQKYISSDTPNDREQFFILKMNILKFMSSLLGTIEQPRYLYFYGPGGIGKTYFIHELSTWIERVMPKAVHFESLVITSPEELEGSSEKPGAFLRILRNQCLAKKRGSILYMDEANWLNQEDMISASKRVFNGELSHLSTSYFGSGIDGTGIHLKTPPMLIIASGNEEIEDEALKNRFDIIHFPMPKPETLINYGIDLFKKDNFVQGKIDGALINSSAKEAEIRKRLQDSKNFRSVNALISAMIGKFKYE